MSTDRDTTRIVRLWLMTDEHESADRVLGTVLDRLDTTPQRRATWWPARRTPTMNRFLTIGLGAAAVVVLLFLGSQFLAPPSNVGSGGEPTATPEATITEPTTEPSPSSPTWTGIPEGPVVVTDADQPVQATVNIQSPGWLPLAGLSAVSKDDDGLDAPVTVGGALLAWSWPAGTGFNVYGDPCHWTSTIPETPATTPDEIAAAFAEQASTNASAPVDVTVGGFAGKAITLHVPMSFDLPDATREEKFGDCDNDVFAFYGVDGEPREARNAQGAGQIDELWILDVDGSIVILDAALSPATPAELVEELRRMAESATFETP
jgi:hypothetical protein